MPACIYTPEEERADIAAYASGASLSQLSKRRGVCLETVRNMLKRNGVPRRRKGNSVRLLPNEIKAAILADRKAGMTQQALADKYNVSQVGISHYLHSIGLSKRIAALRTGGKWKAPGGYVFVWMDPESPYVSMTTHQGAILEHRLVVAQQLGRPLTSGETVHHKDGNKLNNDLANLELRQGKHGKGIRYCCADCGSHNVIPY